MAIVNLSGNFQPTAVDNGRNVPLSVSGAPPTDTADSKTSKAPNGLRVVSNNQADSIDRRTTKETTNDSLLEDKQAVETQIEKLQEFNQSIDRSLQFKVDEELGVTIVRVIDKETDELIRQFPPEELINLSRRLKELNDIDSASSGVLLQEKV